MNFLAHYALIRPEKPAPLYVLGNALPDLLPLADPRARFRLSLLDSAPPGTLRDGIALHLTSDQAFHQSPTFAQAQEEIKTLLSAARFPALPARRFFLAHILAELSLDAALLRAEPELADAFYASFNAADYAAACRWAETTLSRPLPALSRVLAQFSASRYLESYATDAGVAEGVSRLCVRARQGAFIGADFTRLTEVVSQAVFRMEELGPLMLAETRQALSPTRERAG